MSTFSKALQAVQAIGVDIKALYAAIAGLGGGGGGPATFKPWFRYKFTSTGYEFNYAHEPGFINIYREGHLLRPTEDYDDTDPTKIVFIEEQESGVEVDIQPYSLEGIDAANARVRLDLVADSANQTSFTDLVFPTGQVDVFVNGWCLPSSAYVEDGVSITLDDGVDIGDEITILANKLVPLGSFMSQAETIQITGNKLDLIKPGPMNLVEAINLSNRLVMLPRTINVPITDANNGDYIRLDGTFSQSFDTVPEKFWVMLHNVGTGEITVNTDGVTYPMYPGELRVVYKTSVRLDSFVKIPFEKIFTTSSTFSKPPGYRYFDGLGWAAGAGGGKSGNASYHASGGGGGACKPIYLKYSALGTTENIIIGAGGTPTTSAGAGGVGGNSSIGSLWTVYGGGPGNGNGGGDITGGGGGGGALSAGATAGNTQDGQGGQPYSFVFSIGYTSGGAGFGGGGDGSTRASRNSAWGGAAGGDFNGNNAGKGVYGAGGGGGDGQPGGTSDFGGPGGAGGTTGDGGDGVVPGGGGGATRTGSRSGAGARGEIRLKGVI